jgi:DNA (cytosine-5)-methyltransferase 1
VKKRRIIEKKMQENQIITERTIEVASAARARMVVDLFSCGGGMSAGFSGRSDWRLAAAVDLEVAKPSGKSSGETGCNDIYFANHGIRPILADLATLPPASFRELSALEPREISCLISCAPCTDFSRANPSNHLSDRERNTLVGRSGDFIADLLPEVFIMENARELINGNHPQHWQRLKQRLVDLNYDVREDVHFLTRFGLPQVRERALIIASRVGPARTLEDLWEGWEVPSQVTTVRSALSRLDEWLQSHDDDEYGSAYPGTTPAVTARLAATPPDGGSWVDVATNPTTRYLCTPDCLRRWESKKLGSHPDVYGRMWWDRPAPTIKRECAHIGNGRYTHPELNRLLSVREMATLQGFPFTYKFPTLSVANRYRAIGDAVPPLIAWQIAACVEWTITGRKPEPEEWVMPNTSLRLKDLQRKNSFKVKAAA